MFTKMMQQLKMVTGVLGAGVKGKLFKDTLGKWKEIFALKNLLNDTSECHNFFCMKQHLKRAASFTLEGQYFIGQTFRMVWIICNYRLSIEDMAMGRHIYFVYVVFYRLYVWAWGYAKFVCCRKSIQGHLCQRYKPFWLWFIHHFGFILFELLPE